MTDHAERHFETHGPIRLYVENDRGSVEIRAGETTETAVRLEGPDAEAAHVELDGRSLTIVAPRAGTFRSGGHGLDIVIALPAHSDLAAKLGSADLAASGTLGEVQIRSGSGEVRLDEIAREALVETGSGDVALARAGAPLRIKSGSGDVRVGEVAGELSVSTGSGDVRLDAVTAAAAVKTGSGDLTVGRAHADLGLATGSGDLVVEEISAGRVEVKGASTDILMTVASGVPVWTDVSSVTGSVRSRLESLGEPGPDQDHVELRARTVSGDIRLAHA